MKDTKDKEIEEILEGTEIFYNDNEAGGSSRWLVTPDTVRNWFRGILRSYGSKREQRVLDELDNFAGIYGWHLPKCMGIQHQPDCPVVLLKRKILKARNIKERCKCGGELFEYEGCLYCKNCDK